jgi:hypothetical protein
MRRFFAGIVLLVTNCLTFGAVCLLRLLAMAQREEAAARAASTKN